MMLHRELVRKMFKQPVVKAEYEAQAEEFALLDQRLEARQRAGLSSGKKSGAETDATPERPRE